MPPKLFLSGGIYFWKRRQAACSRWKFTCFYGTLSETAFPSFNFHPTTSCRFVLHARAQKQTCLPNLKKPQTWSIYTLTLPQSICPAASVVTQCCFAFLTSWDYTPNCLFRHSTWCHISCRWVVSEKTQWHLSARRREWVGRNIAENKIEQQKEQQNQDSIIQLREMVSCIYFLY